MKVTASVNCTCCGGMGTRAEVLPSLLISARQQSGMSLRTMAKQLQFSAAYLSDIERGRRNCTDKIREAYEALKPERKNSNAK